MHYQIKKNIVASIKTASFNHVLYGKIRKNLCQNTSGRYPLTEASTDNALCRFFQDVARYANFHVCVDGITLELRRLHMNKIF